jgi:hypothetical protein
MGYSTVISHQAAPERWTVAVKVNLSRAETNDLFLSGDSMLSWPVDGLVPLSEDDPMPERSSIFVSEIAAQSSGLQICYSDQAHAERTAALLKAQFAQVGIEEEV